MTSAPIRTEPADCVFCGPAERAVLASAYDVMVARQLVIEQAALDAVKAGAQTESTEAADAEEVVNA